MIPTADRSKATVTVRVELKAKDARILPEMGARVTFLGPAAMVRTPARFGRPGRSVIVPVDAVRTDDGQPVVFVLNDGHAERRAVRLGARTNDDQLLLAGVRAGETVATGDIKRLTDGAKVRVVGADRTWVTGGFISSLTFRVRPSPNRLPLRAITL